MKYGTHRDWPNNDLSRKARVSLDFTTALGSLAAAMLAYILYHLYPLVSKGLLW